MHVNLVELPKLESSFLSCEKDLETILRKLFIESRPYSNELKKMLIINTEDCLESSEYDAIDQYNSAMATAEAEGNIEIIPILKDIIAEEHTHVGQLQAAAKLFDQSVDNIDKGEEEAIDQLEQGAVEETELNDITEE